MANISIKVCKMVNIDSIFRNRLHLLHKKALFLNENTINLILCTFGLKGIFGKKNAGFFFQKRYAECWDRGWICNTHHFLPFLFKNTLFFTEMHEYLIICKFGLKIGIFGKNGIYLKNSMQNVNKRVIFGISITFT